MSNDQPVYGHGKICYLEIPATNADQSAVFYEKIFGWDIKKRDDGTIGFDDGVGGVSCSWIVGRKPVTEAGFLISIMVDDIEDTIELIVKHDGIIVQPLGMEAPELTAHFTDPAGNVLGLYQHRG